MWSRLVAGAVVGFWVSCSPSETTSYRASAENAAEAIEASWLQAKLEALAADELKGRDNLSEGGELARELIVEALEAIGIDRLGDDRLQSFDQGHNILGVIEGTDPALRDEYLVIGAHYDHIGKATPPAGGDSACKVKEGAEDDMICNGAADNASGAATLLAVAKALAQSDRKTRRSILIAFWDAEEDGLLGSTYFTNNPPIALQDMAAMVNIDVVGTTFLPCHPILFALGIEHSEGKLREMVSANEELAAITTYPTTLIFAGDHPTSDHASFIDHKVPVLWFSSGAPPEYHTPQDEPDVVDAELVAATARQVLLTTADAANAEQRPRFVAEPEPQLDDARALVAMGEIVKKDPAAVGLDDPTMLGIIDGWDKQLHEHLASPPSTKEQWEDYGALIKTIMTMVLQVLGGSGSNEAMKKARRGCG